MNKGQKYTTRFLGTLFLGAGLLGALLAGALILGACVNPLEMLRAPEGPAAGTGRVRLSVDGGGERTILNGTPVFSKYVFSFEAKGGQTEVPDPVSVDAADYQGGITVELKPGNWTVQAAGHVRIQGIAGITNGDYPAARGSADITVSPGGVQSLNIDLRGGVDVGGKGILEYALTVPEGTARAELRIRTLAGTAVGEAVNLAANPRGSLALDAGYYLVTLVQDDVSKTEVLHIYGGMTSKLERPLNIGKRSFSSIEDMAAWLAGTGANTKDQPYDIALHGLNLETDLKTTDDSLGKLFAALQGKYVNLDLGACTGQRIPDNSINNSPNRPDKDRLVSLVLPSTLESIGTRAFQDCTSLALTSLPEGITSIGNFAFSNCTSLAQVTCNAVTPPTLNSNAFNNTPANLVIKVPAASVNAYQSAPGWSSYAGKISGL